MANSARTRPNTQTQQEPNTLDRMQYVYENNKKRINTIVTIVLVVLLGYLGYTRLYKAPREDKAATEVAFAQRYFEMDSLNNALNGDGQHAGFLRIMKKYDGTSTANMCHYYAGVCYLHLGDVNNAIKNLKEFDGNGTTLAYQAWGLLGDAYMENGNAKEAINYYTKATGTKDELITPTYLYREAIAYENSNQPDEAKKAYERIRDEFPKSLEARDVTKALAHLGEID